MSQSRTLCFARITESRDVKKRWNKQVRVEPPNLENTTRIRANDFLGPILRTNTATQQRPASWIAECSRFKLSARRLGRCWRLQIRSSIFASASFLDSTTAIASRARKSLIFNTLSNAQQDAKNPRLLVKRVAFYSSQRGVGQFENAIPLSFLFFFFCCRRVKAK